MQDIINASFLPTPRFPSSLNSKGQCARYASRMTLCIAAVCYEGENPRIVLCSDTRGDYAGLGSRNSVVKLDIIGRNWAVQFAGRVDAARDCIEHLKTRFDKVRSLHTQADVLQTVGHGLRDFKKSPLYSSSVDLMITGFVASQEREKPLIIVVRPDENGDLGIETAEHYWAIGEGCTVAMVMLNYRDYRVPLSLPNASYFLYEAKRLAEQVGSVGTFTCITWQRPAATALSHRADCVVLNASALNALEDALRRYGPQPVPPLEAFPSHFFGEPPTNG